MFIFKAFNKIKNILKFSFFLLVGGEVSGLDCQRVGERSGSSGEPQGEPLLQRSEADTLII